MSHRGPPELPLPRLEISLDKINQNTKLLVGMCHGSKISVIGVTKAFCGCEEIARSMEAGGVDGLADSRIENLKRLHSIKLPKLLLRLPMISQALEAVEYADISLNSEIATLKALSAAASSRRRTHRVILMFDLGDLREGIFDEADLLRTVESALELDSIVLAGIGTNLTCQSGLIPTEYHLARLVELRKTIENRFDIVLDVTSGGSSSTLHLLEKAAIPTGINQLRLGEAILLGRETSYGHPIVGTHDDCFRLITEIIEIKKKPSVPTGEIGLDAFGNKPIFTDKGVRTRALCAIGRQDVFPQNMAPEDGDIAIIGASSDHLILDMTDCHRPYQVGDMVHFKLRYGGILSCMTSSYVSKAFV